MVIVVEKTNRLDILLQVYKYSTECTNIAKEKKLKQMDKITGKLGKIIRVLTVAPAMALLLAIGGFAKGNMFISWVDLLFTVLFLTVLPLLAYPLQPVIPHFKDKGRDGQRNLAMIFAVLGYVGGIIYSFAADSGLNLKMVFMTYLISGVMILFSSKVLHFKASGHACGIAGPMALALVLGLWIWWIYLPLFIIVCATSVKMKRHTFPQFIVGGIIPVVVTAVLYILL